MANTSTKGQEIESSATIEKNVDRSQEASDPHAETQASNSQENVAAAQLPPPTMQVDLARYRDLYHAALKGDWKTAERIILKNPDALRAKISVLGMTALHIAAGSGHSHFVEQLAKQLSSVDLEMKDGYQATALHYAAFCGSLKTMKALVGQNEDLTEITGITNQIPLMSAIIVATEKQREAVWYLYLKTKNPFPDPADIALLSFLTIAGLHDITLHLLQRYPHKATIIDGKGITLLSVLATKPTDFLSGSRLTFWERWIYKFAPDTVPYSSKGDTEDPRENLEDLTEMSTSKLSRTLVVQVRQWLKELIWKAIELAPCSKKVQDAKLRHKWALKLVTFVCDEVSHKQSDEIIKFFQDTRILHYAAFSGIVEIVKICLIFFPDLISIRMGSYTLFHIAIQYRHEMIFNLLNNQMNARRRLFANTFVEKSNSILHLAAKLSPPRRLSSVSGPALQMQREMQWFKEVEKWINPEYKDRTNDDGKTAWELFTEEHKDLVAKGEMWMKDTSNSCMVVTTLITTVVFAAAFTVPGGNNSEGIPIFIGKSAFKVFVIADALAFLSSLTSLLMFLSILTARYAEEDYLKSLPLRLIIGLTTLFFAIATVMIAFVAALWIILDDRLKWVTIPITILAFIPVILFAKLQLLLFIQMFQSTCGSGIFRPQKLW